MTEIKGVKRANTNIDLLMLENGIKTDIELGKRLNLTQQQVSRRLRGKMSLKTLELFALFFGVSIKDLLR